MTQRKLNLRSLVITGIGMVLLSACMKSRHEGFEESETGLYYAIHKESGATKTPKEGDILWCKMQLLLKGADGKKDSMLYDSDDAPDFPGGIKFIQYVKPEYEGDLMEGVSKLHIGDSASFIVSADSFFLPWRHGWSLHKPGNPLDAPRSVTNRGTARIHTPGDHK